MTSTQNPWLFFGAAVVGIVSAAGLIIVEHFRQERRRHTMAQDLARLDRQLSTMRKELEQLRSVQKERQTTSKTRRNHTRTPKPVSTISVTSDDYRSALDIDSSDMEFYDVSDDDETASIESAELANVVRKIDSKLDSAKVGEIETALDELKDLCMENPQNPELLWRIGKAHHKLFTSVDDVTSKQNHIAKGVEACQAAINIKPDLAEAHKWFAILVGCRGDFQPMKERIEDGHIFKKHVDIAVKLNPDDASLHHMLGRFAFEVASLKWYERKAAATFFAEPPQATYEEALCHFMAAEKLAQKDWKENKLLIAKCQLAMGEYSTAVDWLIQADEIYDNSLDDKVDTEVKNLLEKYNSYR